MLLVCPSICLGNNSLLVRIHWSTFCVSDQRNNITLILNSKRYLEKKTLI